MMVKLTQEPQAPSRGFTDCTNFFRNLHEAEHSGIGDHGPAIFRAGTAFWPRGGYTSMPFTCPALSI
jgi:hypothetical protein